MMRRLPNGASEALLDVALTVVVIVAMVRAETVTLDRAPVQAARGDAGRGDALIAFGIWIDQRLERALAPFGGLTVAYFAGHIALSWTRGLF